MNFRATSTFKPVDLVALQQRSVPKIVAAIKEGQLAVTDEAIAYAPVRSGELVSDIGPGPVEIVGTVVTGTVESSSDHAGFVEFGTGKLGEGTYPGTLPQTGVPYTGSWVYDFRNQNWQGHAAQPYMRPALDSARPAIRAAFEKQGFKV